MSKKTTRKNSYYRRTPAKTKSSSIGWLLGGIAIGLLLPTIFYWKSTTKSHPTVLTDNTATDIKIEDVVTSLPPPREKTRKLSNPPNQPSGPQTNYEFYNLLAAQDNSVGQHQQESKQNNKFTLLIAGFNAFTAADQLKAQLVLLGIDAVSIVKSVKDSHMIYQVMVGPYPTKQAAIQTQQQLKDNAIHSTIILE